jgi:hypothetical protein
MEIGGGTRGRREAMKNRDLEDLVKARSGARHHASSNHSPAPRIMHHRVIHQHHASCMHQVHSFFEQALMASCKVEDRSPFVLQVTFSVVVKNSTSDQRAPNAQTSMGSVLGLRKMFKPSNLLVIYLDSSPTSGFTTRETKVHVDCPIGTW